MQSEALNSWEMHVQSALFALQCLSGDDSFSALNKLEKNYLQSNNQRGFQGHVSVLIVVSMTPAS